MTTKINKGIELGLDIAIFLNEVNHNTFTMKEVLTENSIEYQYMLENNDKQSILDTLQNELTNSYGSNLDHTLKCSKLIHEVINF